MPARRGAQASSVLRAPDLQPPVLEHDPTEEENLAQLQRAVEQSDDASNEHSNGNAAGNGGPSTPATDGARKPAALGADYSSLRLLTRRQPDDPGAVLDGMDTSTLDLSWTAREGPENLDPNGQPWRYPKKKGKMDGSNLDQFKDDITERTKNGQGCKAISEAYIAMGVDTSVRAVARQRMKWGLRQRAQRKMTEQGLANIRKAHLEHAKRMANSDPLPVKRVRIRVMRKAEITRMTKEGMTAAAIAENLTARGVKLTRGAATVERLRTVWGLTADDQRSVNNIRATARNHALKTQKEQFENIARELGIEDVDAWVQSKMDEEVAQEARREYSYKLMGNARPKPQSVEQARRNVEYAKARKREEKNRSKIRTQTPGVDSVPGTSNVDFLLPQQQGESDSPTVGSSTLVYGSVPAASGANAPMEVVELSDDDSEDEDMDEAVDAEDSDLIGSMEAMEGRTGHEADGPGIKEEPQDTPHGSREATQQPPSDMRNVNTPIPAAIQATQVEATQQPPMPALCPPNTNSVFSLGSGHPSLAPSQVTNVTDDPRLNNGVLHKQYGYTGAQFAVPNTQAPPYLTKAPPAGMPGRPSATAYVAIAPRPLAIAPPPPPPRTHTPQPCAAQPPPFHPSRREIDEMAEFGLTPYPCPGKPPQKYLTPKGMITTDGYEYLAAPPSRQANTRQHVVGDSMQIHLAQNAQAQPQAFTTPQMWSVTPIEPPPEPLFSQISQPQVVVPVEETQKMSVEARIVEGYHKISQECLDMLFARANCRPMPNSLTGLPPSLKDVQLAKERLKEAANALLVEL